ncbi:MAG TPA: ABC transporter permease, partial [Planctomycetota bacterium]|nr:ABC transporter permease [Planctomycetota bacterium]
MSTLVSLASLRGLARHPWQIALSVLGIALGVAVVVGIDLASASSLRGFRLSTEALVGTATHEIRGGSDGLPEELFARLLLAEPEIPMAPVVDAQALVLGLTPAGEPRGDGPRTVWTVFGVDAFSEAALRPWLGDLGAGAAGSLELLSVPASGLLSDASARELGIQAGDSVRLRVGSHVESVRVIGTIVPGSPRAKLSLDGVLVVDIATAQELRHAPGKLTHVDLALPVGARGDAAAERIRALRPPGATLAPAVARSRGLEEMTEAFRLNLRALSLLALLVGVFLVYNTMTFSVVQRRGLIATLRTLGVVGGGADHGDARAEPARQRADAHLLRQRQVGGDDRARLGDAGRGQHLGPRRVAPDVAQRRADELPRTAGIAVVDHRQRHAGVGGARGDAAAERIRALRPPGATLAPAV